MGDPSDYFPTPPERLTDGSLRASAVALCMRKNMRKIDREYLQKIKIEMEKRGIEI